MKYIIFFNGGWMENYNGIGSDSISGGGRYIEKHGFGGEVYNFRDCDGICFGYVMAKNGSINLSRVGGSNSIEKLEDVLCVFVAKYPSGGRRIIGWYKKATLFSDYMEYSGDNRTVIVGEGDWPSPQVGYYALTQTKNATRMTVDERLSAPKVPSGKGGFGQSNVWYADSEFGIVFRNEVFDFIAEYGNKRSLSGKHEFRRKKKARVDVASNKIVESIAVNKTIEYYNDLGYVCVSVEDMNTGWDIECSKDDIKLFVEVKGLSQSDISVTLTRNEYEKMLLYKEQYRMAVVTNCQEKSHGINIFSFDDENACWHDQFGNTLTISEIVSARCTVE